MIADILSGIEVFIDHVYNCENLLKLMVAPNLNVLMKF